METHGSDVVEVASATSLHTLTSVLTSTLLQLIGTPSTTMHMVSLDIAARGCGFGHPV